MVASIETSHDNIHTLLCQRADPLFVSVPTCMHPTQVFLVNPPIVLYCIVFWVRSGVAAYRCSCHTSCAIACMATYYVVENVKVPKRVGTPFLQSTKPATDLKRRRAQKSQRTNDQPGKRTLRTPLSLSRQCRHDCPTTSQIQSTTSCITVETGGAQTFEAETSRDSPTAGFGRSR